MVDRIKILQDSPGLSDLHLVLDDGVVHTQKLLLIHSIPFLGQLIKNTNLLDNDPVTIFLPGISRWVKVFTEAFPTTVAPVPKTFFQMLKTFLGQKKPIIHLFSYILKIFLVEMRRRC